MRRTTLATAVLLCGALSSSAAGCFFDYMNDCSYNITLACFYENAGGSGGTGGSSPECIPSETNPLIEDGCGVFVSAQGSDANGKGTKEAPYLTLGKALSEGSVVYACADETSPFDEAVEVSGEATIYGGMDCTTDWRYDPTKKSAWTAAADAVPLRVGGEGKVEVYDFAITARDAEQAGGSSIGVLAVGPAELVLERCEVTAGNGQVGETPAKPAGVGMAGQPGENGQDGCTDSASKPGGNGGQSMCEGTSQNGGNGGNGTTGDGSQGSDGDPVGDTGKGGKKQDATGCTPGGIGAEGAPGQPGDGGQGLGTLTEAGYTGVSGGDGKTKGSPGQGGGGGGGAKVCATAGIAGPGGGGGGSGGCGGEPGQGGGPGGASIGIASVGATLTLSQVTITSKTGGTGGTGGDGQLGGLGGLRGTAGSNAGDTQALACDGGSGGKGGDGGGGGGGLGGHSVGIAFTGAAPMLSKTVTIQAGLAAFGGMGGNMTMEASARGAPGRTCETLSFEDGSCTK